MTPREATLLLLGVVGVFTIVCCVVGAGDNQADVILQEEDSLAFINAGVVSKDASPVLGAVQMGAGWCLDAPKKLMDAAVTVSKCSKDVVSQRWTYSPTTGLVQVAGGHLCLHADYVSEPEGALTSLQPCKARSVRQRYQLDAHGHRLQLRSKPGLCVQSMETEERAGQPVLVMACNAESASEATTSGDPDESTLSLLAGELNDDHEAKSEAKQAQKPVKARVPVKEAKAPVQAQKPVKARAPVKVDASAAIPATLGLATSTTVQGPTDKAVKPLKKLRTKKAAVHPSVHSVQVETGASLHSTMESEAEAALAQIQVAVKRRHEQDAKIKAELRKAKNAVKKAGKAAKSKAVKDAMKKTEADSNLKLLQTVKDEKTILHSVVTKFQQQYEAKAVTAKNEAETAKKLAQDRASFLQRAARAKTAAVIAAARKKLHMQLKASLQTLTESTDKRQSAKDHLVKLRASKADEVTLAQAALSLAKVNKRTRLANEQARRAVRLARQTAANSIKFARTMAASRLKAIQSTAHLRIDKAELASRATVAESQELLSRAKQQVLMALDAADGSLPLKDVLNEDDVVELDQTPAESNGRSIQMEQADTDVEGLAEEDRVGNSIVHAKEDTIYTAKMHRCVFPFLSNGQKYYHCRESTQGHWCATKVDAEQKATEWDYCVLNQHAVLLAKQAAMAAAQIEIKRVLKSTGAKLTPETLRESLHAASAAQEGPNAGAGQPSDDVVASKRWHIGKDRASSNVDRMIETSNKQEASSMKKHDQEAAIAAKTQELLSALKLQKERQQAVQKLEAKVVAAKGL